MKRNKKKVIVITIIVITIALYMFFYTTQLASSVDNHTKMQLNATVEVEKKSIDLPNGSVSTIEITTIQDNTQSWIGTSLSDLTPSIKNYLNYTDQNGVYIQDTLRDSPAQIAGILPGDILIKINNTEITEVHAAIKLIASLNPGNTYAFIVFRQGEYLNYTVTPKQHFS